MKGDSPPAECDVVIVGAGAGGLSAAIAARLGGLDVCVVEKAPKFGGCTARSGGMLWLPCNPLSQADGVKDTLDNALAYIQAEAGNLFDRAKAANYLRMGPQMVLDYQQRTSAMRFVRNDAVGDNHPNLPGALEAGRTLTVPAFDGRELGVHLARLADPLDSLTFLGMQIRPGRELNHFFNAFRSWRSFRFAAGRLLAHARDRLVHGRTTRLANGNALVARLAKSALDLDVPIVTSCPAKQLQAHNGAITAVRVEHEGRLREISVRRGVVLACGGFPHDPARRDQLLGPARLGRTPFPLAPASNTGDGLTLAESVGGAVERRLPNTISWVPVSEAPTANGPCLFPHGFDRCKPGVIAVTKKGRRFYNEGAVGSDFIRAMAQECGADPIEGFLIADSNAMRRYGLGAAPPWPCPLHSFLRSGYLLKADSLNELALKTEIDADALAATVAAFNLDALSGVDHAFGRGIAALERRSGDPAVKPNPCLGPLIQAPFYAIRILPGEFSTLAGLKTDAHARVLDEQDRPIEGLYAVGNDSNSMFGGTSPAGGATLGPALTFGYIAGQHLAERAAGGVKQAAASVR